MRWALIENLRDLKLGLVSECPCQSEMTEREIMAAMNKNGGSSVFVAETAGLCENRTFSDARTDCDADCHFMER